MNPSNVVILILVAAAMAACNPAPQSKEGGSELTVDVMSFNIRYPTKRDGKNQWVHRKELVCEVIRQQSPDVIGVQEAVRFQLDDLRAALPTYGEVGVGREGGAKGEYSAVLYRADKFDVADSGTFWLSDTPEVPSVHWGNNLFRICTWARLVHKNTGRAFFVFNTHLDHRSQPSREKSVRLIISRIANRTHQDGFVLMGDFNADEKSLEIAYLKGPQLAENGNPIPLVDTFRVLYPDAKEAGTSSGFAGRRNGRKIDFIMVTPQTKVLQASIVRTEKKGRYPSDHYPITARLRFADDSGNKKAD